VDGAKGSDLTEAGAANDAGRHATNLELFLDLVFVFAVTQVASLLGSSLTIQGFIHGLLLAWLVWWLWSQFTWLGTALDLTDRSTAQFQVLATIPLTLLMAVALPAAFTTSGLQFAGAYLAVALWALAIQGWSLRRDPATRIAWLRYVPLAAAAPIVLVIGAFAEGGLRVVIWAAVAIFYVASALAAGARSQDDSSEWSIDPVHFAERHALFVIISLGEILVAVGTSAASSDVTTPVGLGLIAAVGVTCALWWAYFAYVPQAVEHSLRRATGRRRGDTARDLFTFGHFPIVFGLLLFAVAAKHAVAHPTEPLSNGDLAVLAGAIALFVGGLMGLHWRNVRRVSPERAIVLLLIPAVCWAVGPLIPGVALFVVIAVFLVAMQAVSVRRYERLVAR
jgi:low temperature requirement protein LtrA